MNQEVKKLWVEALRSGKYKQGKHCLKTDDGRYCCLGVLCEVSGQPYDSDWLGVPNDIVEWADLDTWLPEVIDGSRGRTKLSHLNDASNFSFEQIADLIEEQL